ncbi:hypothetical protein [Listeria monocytogenes]|uniref:hypothetical protein n=1 Tax=Listeria monocytogenes TaxID=1639 RepID=UPI00077A2FF0|nr:hypothetical protein [Listeria monocytogenes]KXW94121.1 hypothetical protein AWI96_14330 [Listeria monocytogenes]
MRKKREKGIKGKKIVVFREGEEKSGNQNRVESRQRKKRIRDRMGSGKEHVEAGEKSEDAREEKTEPKYVRHTRKEILTEEKGLEGE